MAGRGVWPLPRVPSRQPELPSSLLETDLPKSLQEVSDLFAHPLGDLGDYVLCFFLCRVAFFILLGRVV